jgi:tocopherol O-methyltransferase
MAVTPRRAPTTVSVARHYDEIDPYYRELWGDHVHHGLWETGRETVDEAVTGLAARVAAAAGLLPHGRAQDRMAQGGIPAASPRVVDIGCGYGATARLLGERYGAHVTGITLSPVQAERARRLAAASSGSGSIDIRCGDWLANDLPDGAFDTAIAIESTEHMPLDARVFREAARILRPGGRLAVCAWLAAPDATAWQVECLLRPICDEGRLHAMETPAECSSRIASGGFRDIAFEDLSAGVARTWSVVAARLGARLARPSTWRYLLDGTNSERVFALTVFRLLAAYRTGALRYGLFTAVR